MQHYVAAGTGRHLHKGPVATVGSVTVAYVQNKTQRAMLQGLPAGSSSLSPGANCASAYHVTSLYHEQVGMPPS